MHENDTQTAEASDATRKGGASDDGHGKDMVEVHIDNKPVTLHRGSTAVGTLKEKGGVPAGYELALETPEKSPPFEPLADDGKFTVKGGERFMSYPRDSGSSGPSHPGSAPASPLMRAARDQHSAL